MCRLLGMGDVSARAEYQFISACGFCGENFLVGGEGRVSLGSIWEPCFGGGFENAVGEEIFEIETRVVFARE